MRRPAPAAGDVPFFFAFRVTAPLVGRPSLDHVPPPSQFHGAKMNRKFLIVTALVAGVATSAEAQICAGTAPFTAGQMRVGAGAEFPEGATTYGGELAWGHQSGMYLGGVLAR